LLVSVRVFYKKWIFPASDEKKHIVFFLLIAISASLPVMVSPKQLGFYLVPSLSFFALSLAGFSGAAVKFLLEKVNLFSKKYRIVWYSVVIITIMLFSGSLFLIDGYSRDQKLIEDVKTAGEIIGRGKIVSICPGMFENWVTHAYFARYRNISLIPGGEDHEYFLTDNSCNPGSGYFLHSKLNRFELYRK
jgi:hypothetical protein